MKIRKLTLCALAAIAALATACSNDEPAGSDTPQEEIMIKATAETPQGSADTRLTHTDGTSKMNIVWAANDKFTVYASASNKTDYSLENGAGLASASFTGSWNATPASNAKLYALYPANATTDPAAITLSLENQKGTADGLKDFNYMTAGTTYSGTGDLAFGAFSHRVAIVKLVLTFPSGVEGDASNIGLKATGLNKSTALNLTAGTYSGETAGDVTTGTNTLPIASNPLTAYLCVFPGSLSNAKAIATVGSDNYEADLSDLSIVAGNMYTATVTMKKSIIGYYYYNDGSCESTYTNSDKACIGIVFWESEDGTQAKIADLTDSEIIMWADNSQTKEWGFSNKLDGTAATKALISDQVGNDDFEYYYPLFHWLYATKNNNNIDGRWYIPAIDELEQLLKAATENETFKSSLPTAGIALKKVAATKPAWYWTCTEGRPGSSGALAINVAQITATNTVQIGFVSKDGETYARAISAITINN